TSFNQCIKKNRDQDSILRIENQRASIRFECNQKTLTDSLKTPMSWAKSDSNSKLTGLRFDSTLNFQVKPS
ncbi:MAG: hypothetical protein KDD63_28360, partial [Bacteroidetes bacterium]|nr:hypothetical protein [Bacteroidota bacterium]